jgi:hypothetical protein
MLKLSRGDFMIEEKLIQKPQKKYEPEYEEYLKTLTEEERKIIRETKSLRNGEMNVTPEERKRFEEFRKVL